jgi:thioredoxin 1
MITETAGAGNIIGYIAAGAIIGYILYSFLKAGKRMNKPPSENVIILKDATFMNEVSSGVSLVDFWAVWCGPCKVQGPIIDEIADEMKGQAKICKLDVDKNPEMARKFGVQSIPTLILFRNGNPVQKFVGVKPKQALMNAIKSHL